MHGSIKISLSITRKKKCIRTFHIQSEAGSHEKKLLGNHNIVCQFDIYVSKKLEDKA